MKIVPVNIYNSNPHCPKPQKCCPKPPSFGAMIGENMAVMIADEFEKIDDKTMRQDYLNAIRRIKTMGDRDTIIDAQELVSDDGNFEGVTIALQNWSIFKGGILTNYKNNKTNNNNSNKICDDVNSDENNVDSNKVCDDVNSDVSKFSILEFISNISPDFLDRMQSMLFRMRVERIREIQGDIFKDARAILFDDIDKGVHFEQHTFDLLVKEAKTMDEEMTPHKEILTVLSELIAPPNKNHIIDMYDSYDDGYDYGLDENDDDDEHDDSK